EGDDERLRDGLAVRKRQRSVLVGEVGEVGRDEAFPRDARHRREDALVRDAPPQQLDFDPARGRHAARATPTPKCRRKSDFSPVIDPGGSSKPIVSIGTSESSAASEPWLPPPTWLRPARSANSQPGAAATITSPAFGLRSAASARARPSGKRSSSVRSSSPPDRATSEPSSRKTATSTDGSSSKAAASARGSSPYTIPARLEAVTRAPSRRSLATCSIRDCP